jgi:hypothetical protein
VHVAGADHEADTVLFEPVGHRGVALLPGPVVVQLEHGRRHARVLGALERPRARPVRRDGGDRQARVDQRLEVRPLPGDEDPNHAPLAGNSSGPAKPASGAAWPR